MSSLSDEQVEAALAVVESPTIADHEKIELLMEIAMALQHKPRAVQDLHHAVALYERALALCPGGNRLLAARLRARKGTALNAIPHEGPEFVEQARELFESSLKGFQQDGLPEEVAETEMNLGLALHTLAASGRARVTEAIGAYLRALRVFTREAFPTEFAILHNNLATAYLSMPMTEGGGTMREALAVQSFEEALKVVTLVDQPAEYAMLQNNLGNALQYVSSTHSIENNLRAVAAYDEALKVRNAHDTPVEYANTIANKANALWNLPDNPADPDSGRRSNMTQARRYLTEACAIFERFGDLARVRDTSQAVNALDQELQSIIEASGPPLAEMDRRVQ